MRFSETSVVQLIDDLIYSATPIPTAAVTSEFIAYLCAIELLLPSPYVQAVKNMIQQLGVSSLKVAHTFKIPQKVIEHRISNQLSHFFKQFD